MSYNAEPVSTVSSPGAAPHWPPIASDLPLATADTPGAAPTWPPPITDSRVGIINVMEAPYYASGDDSHTHTVGTTAPGTTVTLLEDIGFIPGHGVLISGAGESGANYIGTVVSCNGTALVVTPATSTSVGNGYLVQHDDTAAIQAGITAAGAAGGGVVCGYGHSLINRPLQDTSGANAILTLPQVAYGSGMHAIDITLRGPWTPHSTDSGRSVGGWIIETQYVYDDEGTGAMLSGWAPTGQYGDFTACFLTLEDVVFRAQTNPRINGINAYWIGRVNGKGTVVVDTGVSQFITTHDKYAFRGPAYGTVPVSHMQSLTLMGFGRSLIANERMHIDALYTSYSAYPIEVNTAELSISYCIVDKATTIVRTTGSAPAWIKIGLLAADQVDNLVDDPSNYLHGEISYKPATGTLLINGGKTIAMRELGKDYEGTYFSGTAGTGDLAANKLCYYADGSSTLLHAKADAVATARKIMGVTTKAVTATASAKLQRKGAVRITVDNACSPVIGAPAYLSGATAGTVTSALTGAMYPRLIGTFLEGVADSSSTVLVSLDLNDRRDDNIDWVILDTVLTGTATSNTVAVTRALWRELRYEAHAIGDGGGAGGLTVNDATCSRWFSTGATLASGASATPGGMLFVAGGSEKQCNLILNERFANDTNWLGEGACYTAGGNATEALNAATSRYWQTASTIGADAGARSVFRIGSRIYVTGKARMA